MPQSSGSLQKKLKTALNETRLLVLGSQILLGFQFQGVFQESFGELSPLARSLDAVALLLMVTTLGLLTAPSLMLTILVATGEPFSRHPRRARRDGRRCGHRRSLRRDYRRKGR